MAHWGQKAPLEMVFFVIFFGVSPLLSDEIRLHAQGPMPHGTSNKIGLEFGGLAPDSLASGSALSQRGQAPLSRDLPGHPRSLPSSVAQV